MNTSMVLIYIALLSKALYSVDWHTDGGVNHAGRQQGHYDTPLGGAGDRSNLAVTSQPALPPELMPPPHKSVHCHYQEWKARSSQWHIVLTNTKVLALPAMLVVLTGSWLMPSYTDDECIQKPSCSSKLLHEAGIMLTNYVVSFDFARSI